MSAQSAIFNPSQTTSAASGDGFSVPRLTTTGRLAISFTTADKGMMVYDTTLNNLFIWNGSAWESVPASGDAGADGSVQYNDNGVVSGAANLQYNKASGFTSLRSGSALRAYVADNSVYSTITDNGAAGGLTIDNLNADGISLRIGGTNVLNVSAGIATITGNLTVQGNGPHKFGTTNYSQFDQSSLQFVGSRATPGALSIYGNTNRLIFQGDTGGYLFQNGANTLTLLSITNDATQVTLNSTGLGVGGSPQSKISCAGNSSSNQVADITIVRSSSGTAIQTGPNIVFADGTTNNTIAVQNTQGRFGIWNYGAGAWNERLSIDSSGNVGIGVTPSAKLHVSDANLYAPSLTWNAACANIVRSENGQLAMGSDNASPYSFWFQCRTISNTSRDISFNPLGGNFGIGTLSPSNGKLSVTQAANADCVYLVGNSGQFIRLYGWNVDTSWNANAAAIFVGKQTSTSRSINAGGTVNASGADYAEYMTKASDFVLAKGDIVGIDANGKLTNVFADGVSFVVKSTDPSYVGNDKWGVGLEGADLEAARQLVDRIAFAGQVPVNVTGAKAGDYIVPVVNGTGIKGHAVSNPTFEQYQLAVGKVISIDADGRARIIVKVA